MSNPLSSTPREVHTFSDVSLLRTDGEVLVGLCGGMGSTHLQEHLWRVSGEDYVGVQ